MHNADMLPEGFFLHKSRVQEIHWNWKSEAWLNVISSYWFTIICCTFTKPGWDYVKPGVGNFDKCAFAGFLNRPRGWSQINLCRNGQGACCILFTKWPTAFNEN